MTAAADPFMLLTLQDDIRYHLDADKCFLQAAGQKGRPLLAAVARNHLSGVDSQQLER